VSFSYSRAFLEAIVPQVTLEADIASQVMIVFLRQLLFQYHKWINSSASHSVMLESLHVHGGEEAVLEDVSYLEDCVLFITVCIVFGMQDNNCIWKIHRYTKAC